MSLFPFPFPGGSIAPPPDRPAWTTYGRMLRVASAVQLVLLPADDPEFLAIRQDATADLIESWVQAYSPRPGFIRRLVSPPHPILGDRVPDPTIVPPSRSVFAAAVRGGGVTVDNRLAEAVARLAVAEAFERQTDQTFNEEATRFRQSAETALANYEATVTMASQTYLVATSGRAITLISS